MKRRKRETPNSMTLNNFRMNKENRLKVLKILLKNGRRRLSLLLEMIIWTNQRN
jgi:hypothetical protein